MQKHSPPSVAKRTQRSSTQIPLSQIGLGSTVDRRTNIITIMWKSLALIILFILIMKHFNCCLDHPRREGLSLLAIYLIKNTLCFYFVFYIREIPANPKMCSFWKSNELSHWLKTRQSASKSTLIMFNTDAQQVSCLSLRDPLPGQSRPPGLQAGFSGRQLLPSLPAWPRKDLSPVPDSGPMSEFCLGPETIFSPSDPISIYFFKAG